MPMRSTVSVELLVHCILYVGEVKCSLLQINKKVTDERYAGADVRWLLGIAFGENEALE